MPHVFNLLITGTAGTAIEEFLSHQHQHVAIFDFESGRNKAVSLLLWCLAVFAEVMVGQQLGESETDSGDLSHP